MFDVLGELNWLAIVLGVVAFYILGAVWFTPLFGGVYDKAVGVARKKHQKWPAIYYVGPLLGSIATTLATAVLLYALNIERLADAVMLGIIVGVGYAAAVSLTNAITPNMPRPLLFGALTSSYHVVGIVIAAAIIFGLR